LLEVNSCSGVQGAAYPKRVRIHTTTNAHSNIARDLLTAPSLADAGIRRACIFWKQTKDVSICAFSFTISDH